MRKIIITTGGTGGHVFPAIAVAEGIKRRFPMLRYFYGRRIWYRKRLATRAGLTFVGLPVRGVVGRGFKAFSALFAMLFSIVRAAMIIVRFKPDVVVGFGGYLLQVFLPQSFVVTQQRFMSKTLWLALPIVWAYGEKGVRFLGSSSLDLQRRVYCFFKYFFSCA